MASSIKFKAAILVEQNRPLEIDEIEFKSSFGVGQVLVKLHLSGICGSQIGEIKGVQKVKIYISTFIGS